MTKKKQEMCFKEFFQNATNLILETCKPQNQHIQRQTCRLHTHAHTGERSQKQTQRQTTSQALLWVLLNILSLNTEANK